MHASGSMMWLAAAGWLQRLIYRASLAAWLLMTLLFALQNASTAADRTVYLTPYLGFALALVAAIVEVIGAVKLRRERRLSKTALRLT